MRRVKHQAIWLACLTRFLAERWHVAPTEM